MKVLIAYGTLTMNTELVSERVAEVFEESGKFEQVDLKNMIEIEDSSEIEGYDLLVLSTSTWGEGEMPPDPEEFMDMLIEKTPQIPGVKAVFFGLGESHYEVFCGGIKKMREVFIEQFGVEEILKMKLIDGYPEDHILDEVGEWSERVIEKFFE
jgi:flavodoxin I